MGSGSSLPEDQRASDVYTEKEIKTLVKQLKSIGCINNNVVNVDTFFAAFCLDDRPLVRDMVLAALGTDTPRASCPLPTFINSMGQVSSKASPSSRLALLASALGATEGQPPPWDRIEQHLRDTAFARLPQDIAEKELDTLKQEYEELSAVPDKLPTFAANIDLHMYTFDAIALREFGGVQGTR
ncbi:hypothetical protein PTSG_00455 [Salpingoeca rosetta]|uniref:Uncharacterized protein n=1 Tax=Salpingoeca rosetta (strain ATCC 50818 / BSB-021) TaxID=946362 RepID=F2TWJ0_SALR5|nr:uncharacterized protein PTSG_00455 [Salpingoeca rosetta]EGD72436.1 hypothetical protein PTSG_00455 [Salpingoeca rosetta]|eukprot:XP_004999005.1 hypothetical protein PTSG_00455 [Salpingoeca rosetta]